MLQISSLMMVVCNLQYHKIHFSLKIPSQQEEIAAEINLSSKSRENDEIMSR